MAHTRKILERLGDARGQSLVELALVLPLFLLLVFGLLDFGKALNYWLDENQLASAGARLAAVGKNSAAVTAYVKSNADTSELSNGAAVSVEYPDGCQVGKPVTVRITYSYAWLNVLTTSGFGVLSPTSDIAGSATMRLEQSPAGGCA